MQISKEKLIRLVNSLPDERFVEVLNLYAESEKRPWRIYKNTKEEFNQIFSGTSPWGVAGEILASSKCYRQTDAWLILNIDYGLISDNNPRKLIPYMMNVMDYMAVYYLHGYLSAPLIKLLDEIVEKDNSHSL